MIRYFSISKETRSCEKSFRGSILVGALAILFILLTIFISALTYALARYSYHLRAHNELIAKYLAEAGIARSISEFEQGSAFPAFKNEKSPNGGYISAKTHRWGPYKMVVSQGKFANQTVAMSAQIGSMPPTIFEAAITVCDSETPFVVGGASRIVGDINTGVLGMTRGQIKGEAPSPDSFFVGSLHTKATWLVPLLDSSVFESYESDIHSRRSYVAKTIYGTAVYHELDTLAFDDNNCLAIENGLEIRDLRYEATKDIHSLFVAGNVEVFGNSKLGGLLEIVSDRAIIVRDSSYLDNLILFAADSIVIGNRVHFSGTAVSNGSIIVKDSAFLDYPSTLFVNSHVSQKIARPSIVLSSRSPMASICVVQSQAIKKESAVANVYLDTLSTLQGIIMTNGKTDLRGTLLGAVVTNSFQFYEHPTTYINWIHNCVIDRRPLKFDPILPLITPKDSPGYAVFRMDKS